MPAINSCGSSFERDYALSYIVSAKNFDLCVFFFKPF